MDFQVTLYANGQLAEFGGGQLLRLTPTHGDLATLLQVLRFSRSTQFIISTDPPPSADTVAQSRGGQQISDIGLKLLTTFEGCELNSYDDSVGVWTIGYGHTAGVVPGMSITQEKAEELLRQDLEQFESFVADLAEVELSSDQFSALVCFCFNVGPEAFRESTLRRLLNEGNFEGAAQQFLRWNKGDGKPMLGLTRRRLAEQALFLSKPWEFAQSYDGPLDIPVAESARTTKDVAGRSLKLTDPQMQGDDVQRLQLALQKAGLNLEADGIFGQATDVAVRQLQQQKGLKVDGIAGSFTLSTLA
jgi:lysozyme